MSALRVKLGRDILLVKAVARFVQRGENRHRQIILVIAGGDADIVSCERDFEGVGRAIEPPPPEVETDQFRHLAAERFLSGEIIFALPEVDR